MKFGPVPPKRPPQQDASKVLRLAERWQRAADAHSRWAEPAKRCVDMFEGRQWTEAQLVDLRRRGRPNFKFNVIAPLVRLILGYHRSHKTDIAFQPGQDGRSSEDVAEVLTRLEKQIAIASRLEFVDTEVFMDGLVASRGFYDTRLDWEDNDLGAIITKALDPFSTYLDPDAGTYDLNDSASYLVGAKWVSIDEIEGCFGKETAGLIRPFASGMTPLAPLSSLVINGEITPLRSFGHTEDLMTSWWDRFYELSGDFVDTYRKTVRLLEFQYKVREPHNVIIDMETGDKKVLPDNWDQDKINKTLLYCQQIGNPCVVEKRMVEHIQWTTVAGDLILYDAPSYYDRYTVTGYFPYFRRGMTRGMVEDLIDPQLEKNKRRLAESEIVSKTASGGWKYHESSLDPVQERNLKRYGATPGFNLKWKGTVAPEVIQPAAPSMAHDRLERKADDDLRTISGINESALGELDRVQSGRAIEARQKQAVLSVQMYMDNLKRSKELVGIQHLNGIQCHYTMPRIVRVLGEDGNFTTDIINHQQQDQATGLTRILNDVTVGKYMVTIDDSPLSATFLNAQWEEMLTLLDKMGPAMASALPMFGDLIIDMSSMPRKQEWIERFKVVIQRQLGIQPQPPGAPPGAPPPGAAQPQPQQALPPPQQAAPPPPNNVVPLQRVQG